MNRISKLKAVFGALCGLVFTVHLHAVPITGTISYVSAAVPSDADLTLATSFSFFPVGIVVSATGDLVGVGANVVNAPGISGLPLGLGPAPLSVPVVGLWSGGGFSFDLEGLSVDFRSLNQFTASGFGTIHGPLGFDDTPGTWTLAITGEGPVIGLAAGSQAVTRQGNPGIDDPPTSVPDAGSSALLLGMGLAFLAAFRRKNN